MNIVVTGMQIGDEGKGKIVDYGIPGMETADLSNMRILKPLRGSEQI